MMSNTLLSMSMVLAKAMVMVERAIPGPCEITADFRFPTVALTMSIDDFTDEYLRPAIDTAMEHKRQLTHVGKFRRTAIPDDMECCVARRGIAARLRRWYDIDTDTLPTRIEMRVRPTE
jgi:hypothetical protein